MAAHVKPTFVEEGPNTEGPNNAYVVLCYCIYYKKITRRSNAYSIVNSSSNLEHKTQVRRTCRSNAESAIACRSCRHGLKYYCTTNDVCADYCTTSNVCTACVKHCTTSNNVCAESNGDADGAATYDDRR